jgi:hypothetical protein
LQSGSHGQNNAQNAIRDGSCYVGSVTPRHIVLGIAAVAVLGLGVYLYVAVNSTSTAVANVPSRSPEAKTSPQEHGDRPVAKAPEGKTTARPGGINNAVKSVATPASNATTAVERPGANIDIKKDELMATANKAYDHGDFDEAIVVAKKVLSNDPGNTRMLRIMVSASCILDDAATAQKNYLLLPVGGNDRADMKRRCDRYGVTFTES